MKRAATLLAGLMAAGLAGVAVGESPWTTQTILEPSSFTISNPCDPTLSVDVTGTYTIQLSLKFMDSGTVQFRYDVVSNETGIDTAVPPHHYTIVANFHESGQDKAGTAGGVDTMTGHRDFISTDGGSNFRENIVAHVTGKKGDVFRADFFTNSLICLGGPNQVPPVVIGKK